MIRRKQVESLARDLGVKNVSTNNLDVLQVLATIKASLRKPVDILVDVGAHKGAFILPAMQALSARKGVCFEPNPAMHAKLREAVRGLDAELRGCALSAGVGSATLHIHSDPEMSSLLDADKKVLTSEFSHFGPTQVEDFNVPVSTLDCELEHFLEDQKSLFLCGSVSS